jgi:hypothetical protein
MNAEGPRISRRGAPSRPEGTVTRGTTAPNRLRRVDRWIIANQARLLRSAEGPPLVVDLGFGTSPVTTVELYERLRSIRPDVEVTGLEIDPVRVEEGMRFLAERDPAEKESPATERGRALERGRSIESGRAVQSGRAANYQGLTFGLGGFELPVPRPPVLVRALNVLRQYDEEEAWHAWDRLCGGLAPEGVLVEGTCDEIGRRAVWVTLGRADGGSSRTGGSPGRSVTKPPAERGERYGLAGGRSGIAEPRTITFSAQVSTLPCPSELAERLPKTLIHRNVPGEPIHRFFIDFDRSWAIATPQSVFGPRQRWIAAVEHLSLTWPVLARPPAGGRARWRLGEVTLPWAAVAPR